MPPNLQAIVLNKGSMNDARDPTAVLVSRMKKAADFASGRLQVESDLKPGDWICPGCLDIQFARNQECRKCGTPNPGPSEMAEAGMSQDPADPADVEQFIADHQFDEQAAQRFREMQPHLQQIVMNKGPMTDARDHTAVLVSRCKMVTQYANGTLQLDASAKPGDWVCPRCLDLQFAKNKECRKCGAPCPAPALFEGGVNSIPVGGESQFNGSAEGDEWLARYQDLQPRAVEAFRSLTPYVQHLVMERGGLDGARDQNAVLLSRVKQAQQGTLPQGKGAHPKPGDWYCPQCNDLQFARNTSCRKCGAPNPGEGDPRYSAPY